MNNYYKKLLQGQVNAVSWGELVTYKRGDIVVHKGALMRSLVNNNRGNDPFESNKWESVL